MRKQTLFKDLYIGDTFDWHATTWVVIHTSRSEPGHVTLRDVHNRERIRIITSTLDSDVWESTVKL